MTFCKNGKRITCPQSVRCGKWLLIALDTLLVHISIRVSEKPTQVRTTFSREVQSAHKWWFPGPEWGQLYRFRPSLQSIIKPLSGRSGSLWLSFTPSYKQVAIIIGRSSYHYFPLGHSHSNIIAHILRRWYCYSRIVDCRAVNESYSREVLPGVLIMRCCIMTWDFCCFALVVVSLHCDETLFRTQGFSPQSPTELKASDQVNQAS